MQPLTGVRVLDFSHFIAGPYCSQTLADHGADVIKVEPLEGEASRHAEPQYRGESLYFATMNRNKRSLAIDLKHPEATLVLDRLVESADVLITNYAVGVPERLNIGYERLAALNPRLVMVHITGYGLTGPRSQDAAFDGVVQALSGIAHLTGERDGAPLKAGVFAADYVAAFNGVIAALLGLQARERSGQGQLMDVSMLDAMSSMLLTTMSEVELLGHNPSRNGSRSKNVFSTTFPTADGYVYIAALTARQWASFAALTGDLRLTAPGNRYETVQGRLESYAELEDIVTAWTRTMTTQQLTDLLDEERIPSGEVNSIDDVLSNEQLNARDMILRLPLLQGQDVVMPGKTIKSTGAASEHTRAPGLGEHSSALLTEVGLDADHITALLERNVIGQLDRQRQTEGSL
ncbi:CaiB/BaiF CoA transferase family protein [Ornithinimicrobium cavernae]|uniref:CaiB/BaiF CoA transferase family protein n=1 Tax=Ornithinimicrobium cavernae TaxID=2666047 RepID=UPI000D69473F|nr:CoA transferase [Ornithinimicrobium cavernae]